MMGRIFKSRLALALMAAIPIAGLLLALTTAPAWAVAPTGACCFNDGSCEDLVAFQCEDAGGDFIGNSCATVNCRVPLAAPLLSAAGLIAAASALLGVGGMRAFSRRRRL